MEIHNEELRDLLDPPESQAAISAGEALPFCNSNSSGAYSNRPYSSSAGSFGLVGGHRGGAAIRECPDGQIVVAGDFLLPNNSSEA